MAFDMAAGAMRTVLHPGDRVRIAFLAVAARQGGNFDAELLDADGIGVAVRSASGELFIPFTAIQAIHRLEGDKQHGKE
jgi:hypothetical protein